MKIKCQLKTIENQTSVQKYEKILVILSNFVNKHKYIYLYDK